MHENDLLASMEKLFATDDPSVLLGSGPDDCALVMADGRKIAFSTDAFAEGSHFLPDADPRDVARKALGASLSDLAASGCRARWVLVSLCLRKGLPPDWAAEFAAEFAAVAREYRIAVIGGDTIASERGTFVSVTVAGEPLPGGPLLRGGGRPGDVLAVTGVLGGSIRGRHLRPEPRLREMESLMHFFSGIGKPQLLPRAAMDISDGLALDLSRLCRESGVGAVVDAEAIPVSDAARDLAAETGDSPLHHALADGEDFELLLAFPPEGWERFEQFLADLRRGGTFPGCAVFTRIGMLTGNKRLQLRTADGRLHPLAPEGYQHQW